MTVLKRRWYKLYTKLWIVNRDYIRVMYIGPFSGGCI